MKYGASLQAEGILGLTVRNYASNKKFIVEGFVKTRSWISAFSKFILNLLKQTLQNFTF